MNVKLYASGIHTEKTKATYTCMIGKLRWHCNRALEQQKKEKKTWYGRQMKYILMNNNAQDIQKHDVQIKQMALR